MSSSLPSNCKGRRSAAISDTLAYFSHPQPCKDPVFWPGQLGQFGRKLPWIPRPHIPFPSSSLFPITNPLTQLNTPQLLSRDMSTRKRKQDEEEALQALPSDESEEEEE